MADNWKLVPCEPSFDMKKAGWVAFRDSDKFDPFDQLADGIASALAATPPMPREEWEQMVERAARTLFAAWLQAYPFADRVQWDDLLRHQRQKWIDLAEAALRAALPGLVIEGEQEGGR